MMSELSSTDQEIFDSSRTGLVVFDLYESAREKIESRGILAPSVKLIEGCRKMNVPIFFTRPMHRPDRLDMAKTMPDMDREHKPYETNREDKPVGGIANSPGSMPLKEFNFREDDYDITKHRWSAFFDTSLDLSLRSRGIDTILIIGGTTHIGVASTVYSARDRDYQVVVVRDACHGEAEELHCFLDFIFPQVCHVRTVDEVLSRLR